MKKQIGLVNLFLLFIGVGWFIESVRDSVVDVVLSDVEEKMAELENEKKMFEENINGLME